MNYIDLTEEEQEEFEREKEEFYRFIYSESRDIPDEYVVKPSETEKLIHHDYDGIHGTHGTWIKEDGEPIDPENLFDEDADD
ncbi:MAG TPA: hypothetical protein VIF37_08095 [Methylobacter sp.]|jgi:hypothetical protein